MTTGLAEGDAGPGEPGDAPLCCTRCGCDLPLPRGGASLRRLVGGIALPLLCPECSGGGGAMTDEKDAAEGDDPPPRLWSNRWY